MRRSIVLATVLAASTAIFGACEPNAETPNKPAPSTPATTPATSPNTAPSTSPGVNGTPKANTSPEVKKTGDKTVDNTNKDAKPAVTNTNHK